MSQPFVWFHNNSDKSDLATKFYEQLLGWKVAEGPPGMKMFASETGPFAAIGPKQANAPGWVPYLQVRDVESETKRALELGAELLAPKTRGPAGEFSIVRDPGGAAIALWQKA